MKMNEFMKKLAGMVLPSWMNQGEPKKLLKTARRFWAEVYGWITWPLNQFDPLTCAPALLNLLAYDRDITRFDGEPLSLFRKRVEYAFVNARDAGSVEGFINIFERLGIGYVELRERQPGIDWDVILVRVTDSQIANNTQLLIQIIRQYGRTCRRYQFEVITSEKMAIRAGWDQGEYVVYPASLAGTETRSATFSAGL
ncbi:hypothetical protein DB044_10320 [Salmonella enterica]|nr:hypothetical protein [Salmonella enterica]EAS3578995.1 hypothetical protein [Salmonella enterica]EBI8674738.1 hypothetical protein [Salmonella enterica]EBL8753808.1 hypothetical protein [Salmonella enterica]EBN2930290.1 hypothetical protein [Salmonella enterica]